MKEKKKDDKKKQLNESHQKKKEINGRRGAWRTTHEAARAEEEMRDGDKKEDKDGEEGEGIEIEKEDG